MTTIAGIFESIVFHIQIDYVSNSLSVVFFDLFEKTSHRPATTGSFVEMNAR